MTTVYGSVTVQSTNVHAAMKLRKLNMALISLLIHEQNISIQVLLYRTQCVVIPVAVYQDMLYVCWQILNTNFL